MRLVVLISGRGSNLEAVLNKFGTDPLSSIYVAAVVSDNPEAYGLEIAKSFSAPTAVVEKSKSESRTEYYKRLYQVVNEFSPDLVVLAGFMRVLTSDFISPFYPKIINIHPSLLPKYKGLAAQAQALEAGEKIAGCTVHVVTPEIDSGKILGQKTVEVLADDTVQSLSQRILEQEHKLLSEVIEKIYSSELALT